MVRAWPSTLAFVGSAMVLCAVWAGTAYAQVSAEDQQRAAEAYDRATAAYVSGEYDQAGVLFETAHRLAPASAALIQAVRAHERAGHALRAASLAIQLQELYPDDRAAQRAATRAVRAARGDYLRIDVRCDGCTIQVDGALVSHPSFFVEPDRSHRVVGSFETGDVEESVEGAGGETREVAFEAPPPPPEPEVPDEPVGTEPSDPEPAGPGAPPSEGSGGVPLYVSIGALVLTAGLGAVLIWSGVDALDGVPAYEANPTLEGLEDGRGREARTNWLIAGTSVAAAATLVLFLFTDYGEGDGDDVQALFDIREDGAGLGLRGRF